MHTWREGRERRKEGCVSGCKLTSGCGGQYALYRPAARQEDRGFRYQALSFRPYGPFHPIQGKVAAIGITRGGVVSAPINTCWD